MLCETARERLLTADDPACPGADLAEHLVGCAACTQLVADLTHLEETTRSYPTPPSVLLRREAFLANLGPTPPRPVRTRHLLATFAALAAAIVLAVAAVALFRNPGPTPDDAPITLAQANPAVVEDLVEWTLRLTESDAPAEREQLVRERMPELQAALHKAELSADDRAFAEQLLAHGQILAQGADPVDEAERFHGMADTLLVRFDTNGKDLNRSVFYARLYSEVVDRGVDTNLKKAEKQALRVEKQAKVVELRKANKKQAAQAAALVERMPEPARERIKGGKAKSKAAVRPPKS